MNKVPRGHISIAAAQILIEKAAPSFWSHFQYFTDRFINKPSICLEQTSLKKAPLFLSL
jgi:hypothetical protein